MWIFFNKCIKSSSCSKNLGYKKTCKSFSDQEKFSEVYKG